jgi:hypothetical protein
MEINMVSYEEIPNGNWMLMEYDKDDILAHAGDIDTLLSIIREKNIDSEDLFIRGKNRSIIPW